MAQQRSNHRENANPDDQANQVLNQLANMFPGQGLPQAILTSQTNNFLTARQHHKRIKTISVFYIMQKKAIPVNDARVNQLTPISSFEKNIWL